MLLGIVESSFDSVSKSTDIFSVLHISASLSSLPSAVMGQSVEKPRGYNGEWSP